MQLGTGTLVLPSVGLWGGGFGACPQCNPITRRLACRAQTCEELLRYAVYNCMSIDTDTDEPSGLEVAVESPELWRHFVQ